MTYHFNTAAVPSENRFEYYKQAAETAYVRTQLSCADPAGFFAEILVKSFANVNLSEINSSKHFANHRKPAVNQTASRDVFFLQIVLEALRA